VLEYSNYGILQGSLSAFLEKLVHIDRAGRNAQLFHQAQLVPIVPAMNQLAIGKLDDGHAGHVEPVTLIGRPK
jgi:hypothetical protein